MNIEKGFLASIYYALAEAYTNTENVINLECDERKELYDGDLDMLMNLREQLCEILFNTKKDIN